MAGRFGKHHNSSVMPESLRNSRDACNSGDLHSRSVQRVFNTSAPVPAGIAQFQIMATTPMTPVFCLCTQCLSELNENKKGSVVPGSGVEPSFQLPTHGE